MFSNYACTNVINLGMDLTGDGCVFAKIQPVHVANGGQHVKVVNLLRNLLVPSQQEIVLNDVRVLPNRLILLGSVQNLRLMCCCVVQG
jgi:hypothetical protein